MNIYRLRPSNDNIIDELENGYFWFSKPTGFNDIEDANIVSFIEKNSTIEEVLRRRFDGIDLIRDFSLNIGICCFTKELPAINKWRRFPKCYNGVAIEFDKEKLCNHFAMTYGLGDCFKSIDYLKSPTIFKSYSEHDILWEEFENGYLYKSLHEIIKDPKTLDEFFLKMFTRLSDKYKNQNEQRILLQQKFVEEFGGEMKEKGYQIKIPKDAMKRIFYISNTPVAFVHKLEKLNIELVKI